MLARREGEAEQFQAADRLEAGCRVEPERGGVTGLGLQRHAIRTGGAGVVEDMLEQDARDTAATALRGDIQGRGSTKRYRASATPA